ncbi:hypothetical protein QBC44DRAFT_313652 [Cladorrhinum sp. PSN332]|nr:hypothetical protein QBC44DRAFT_313652 [Cladorrhinum sp. PSN332]
MVASKRIMVIRILYLFSLNFSGWVYQILPFSLNFSGWVYQILPFSLNFSGWVYQILPKPFSLNLAVGKALNCFLRFINKIVIVFTSKPAIRTVMKEFYTNVKPSIDIKYNYTARYSIRLPGKEEDRIREVMVRTSRVIEDKDKDKDKDEDKDKDKDKEEEDKE